MTPDGKPFEGRGIQFLKNFVNERGVPSEGLDIQDKDPHFSPTVEQKFVLPPKMAAKFGKRKFVGTWLELLETFPASRYNVDKGILKYCISDGSDGFCVGFK